MPLILAHLDRAQWVASPPPPRLPVTTVTCRPIEATTAPAPGAQGQLSTTSLHASVSPSVLMSWHERARARRSCACAFGAGWHLEWRIRRACSPLDAWGAWQRSRFAARSANCLNVAQRTRQKISRHENGLRLVTAYDRAAAPIESHLNLIFLDVL